MKAPTTNSNEATILNRLTMMAALAGLLLWLCIGSASAQTTVEIVGHVAFNPLFSPGQTATFNCPGTGYRFIFEHVDLVSYTSTPMFVQINQSQGYRLTAIEGFMLLPTQIGPGQYAAASSNPVRLFCDPGEIMAVYFGGNGAFTTTVPANTFVQFWGYVETHPSGAWDDF